MCRACQRQRPFRLCQTAGLAALVGLVLVVPIRSYSTRSSAASGLMRIALVGAAAARSFGQAAGRIDLGEYGHHAPVNQDHHSVAPVLPGTAESVCTRPIAS